jgi:hypothetical protein
VADMLEVLYFLLGGAGGLRLTPLTGVWDLDPALGVLEDVDWNEAAEPGRSIPRVCPCPFSSCPFKVRDSETSLRDDWRTGSRDV